MGRFAVGIVLALVIGALCRMVGLPLPAPPVLIGALLVVAMTIGYLAGERLFAARSAANARDCGGPDGGTANA